ncbi:MAG: DMT family transporter, partial [bacterium]|nr:DMT family transporter [bacterium]
MKIKAEHLVLAVGVLAVSFAAIFIRSADAHPTVIAMMRMSIGAIVMTTAWCFGRRVLPSRQDLPWLFASGLFLSLHFISWIASFSYTSIASSVVLASTQPIFALVLAHFMFKEEVTVSKVVGISICLGGAVIVSLSDIQIGGSSMMYGNLLAIGGAVFGALYFLAGKKLRSTLPLDTYTSFVYSISAIILWAVVLVNKLPLGPFSPTTWYSFFGLGLICTVIGHSSFNYAIGYLPAGIVSISLLGEPIGAAILGSLLLKEYPSGGQIIGGIITLAGII